VGDFPGGSREEVIIAIEVMSLRIVRNTLRMDVPSDVSDFVSSQAHDPTDKEF